MRGSRACLVAAWLLAIFPGAASAQSSRETPNVEARMWCPEHIDEYYDEIRRREVVIGEEGAEYVRAVEVSWELLARYNLGLAKGPAETLLRQLFDMNRLDRESEIMRRVAYGILLNWPAARPRRGGGVLGMELPLGGFSDRANEQATGRKLLRATWQRWKKERKDLLRSLWGVTTGNVFNEEYRKWEARWGPDPDDVASPPPAVTEEFDCKWYMSVEYGFLTDSTLGHGLRFLAVMMHEGHLFDDQWTGANTRVVSHFAAEGDTQRAPYPTHMAFSFPMAESEPFFTEDIYYYTHRVFDWIRMHPRPAPEERSPSIPRLAFDVKYPIWDAEHGIWRYADAVISSSPGPEYRRTLAKLVELKGYGMEAGERLRGYAGGYLPEGKVTPEPR